MQQVLNEGLDTLDQTPYFRKGSSRRKEWFFLPCWVSGLARECGSTSPDDWEKTCPGCKGPNRSVLSYPFTGHERMLFVVKPCDFEDSMLVHFFTFCSKTCLDGWVSEEKDGKLGGITWFAGPPAPPIPQKQDFGRFTGVFCENHLCGNQEYSKTKRFRKCSLCKAVCYCSTGCQREDWPGHKGECRLNRGEQLSENDEKALRLRYPQAPEGWWLRPPPELKTEPPCKCFGKEGKHLLWSMRDQTCSRMGCNKKRFFPRCSEIRGVFCPLEKGGNKKKHYFMIGYCSVRCQRKTDQRAANIAVGWSSVMKVFTGFTSLLLDRMM